MTTDGSTFPVLPPSRVETDEIVRYLAELRAQGHRVFRDSKQGEVFYIQLSDTHRVRISVSGGRSQVQLHYLDNTTAYLDATSLDGVEKAVATLVRKVPGMAWPCRPTEARVSADMPATNYATISGLIGSYQVDAVFDPYLNNAGLEQLSIILSFGSGSVRNGVRLIGSTATTAGRIPRFTKAGVDAWLLQLGIAGDARVVAATSQHRRFLLLSSGHSLILGQSLNSIHKNEAIRLEVDAVDRSFFDLTWAGAAPLT
jgi:hypothetical protein